LALFLGEKFGYDSKKLDGILKERKFKKPESLIQNVHYLFNISVLYWLVTMFLERRHFLEKQN
jgi:hypothetical protein